MSHNKGVVAAGLLVGVILVTGLLRLKFYFKPPSAGSVTPITAYFSMAVLQALEPPDYTTDNDTAAVVDAVITNATTDSVIQTVQPVRVAQAALHTPMRHDLGNGIAPQLAVLPDQYLLGFLVDQRYVVKKYQTNWQAASADDSIEDIVLTEDINLIQGVVPLTYFTAIDEHLYLVYAQSVAGTVSLVLKQYSVAGEWQHTQTLIDGLLPSDQVVVEVGKDGVALAITPTGSTTTTVKLFSIAGQLLTERAFKDQGKVVALIADQAAVIMVSTTPTVVQFTKLSQLGEIQQTVQATVAEAEAEQVTAASRLGDSIALRTATHLILLTDNLSQQYPDLELQSDQLYLSFLSDEQHVWLSYNTATSVTEYAIHVTEYSSIRR